MIIMIFMTIIFAILIMLFFCDHTDHCDQGYCDHNDNYEPDNHDDLSWAHEYDDQYNQKIMMIIMIIVILIIMIIMNLIIKNNDDHCDIDDHHIS